MYIMKIAFTIAIITALAIALAIATTKREEEKKLPYTVNNMRSSTKELNSPKRNWNPPKRVRVSRFLAEEKNRRNATHCKKDNGICYAEGSEGSACCGNKCVDLQTDRENCGECKKKCKYTEDCCRGECVFLAFDKRHCGKCNKKCMPGGYCIYGMCDYA